MQGLATPGSRLATLQCQTLHMRATLRNKDSTIRVSKGGVTEGGAWEIRLNIVEYDVLGMR